MWQVVATVVIVILAAMAAIIYIRRMIQGRSSGCGCGHTECRGSGNEKGIPSIDGDLSCTDASCKACASEACGCDTC